MTSLVFDESCEYIQTEPLLDNPYGNLDILMHNLHPVLCYSFSCVIGCLDRLCNQQLKNSMSNLNSGNCSNLTVVIVCWCYLHYITTNDGEQLASAPAARLWGAGCYLSPFISNEILQLGFMSRATYEVLPGANARSNTSISTLM
jgi:hypothetical protein